MEKQRFQYFFLVVLIVLLIILFYFQFKDRKDFVKSATDNMLQIEITLFIVIIAQFFILLLFGSPENMGQNN